MDFIVAGRGLVPGFQYCLEITWTLYGDQLSHTWKSVKTAETDFYALREVLVQQNDDFHFGMLAWDGYKKGQIDEIEVTVREMFPGLTTEEARIGIRNIDSSLASVRLKCGKYVENSHTPRTHTPRIHLAPSLSSTTASGPAKIWKAVYVLVDPAQNQHEFVPKVNQYFEVCGFKSEHGQDRAILDLMKGLTGGFFVAVGEHGGFYCSNTLLLEQQFDWDGICIEAAPKHLWSLSHRKCKVLSAVISDVEDGWVQFENRHHDGMSGIIGEEFKNKVFSDFSETMPTTRLGRVLWDFRAPKLIDYMSIDTEGAEYSIMKGFPFKEYIVRLLTIEGTSELCREMLRKHGYVFLHQMTYDELWAHRSFQIEMDMFQ